MLDELLDERRHDFLHEAHQKEVIARYCAGLEDKLRSSSGADEARLILEAACRGFESSCPSRMVRNFLNSYAENLYRQLWEAGK